MTEEFKVLIGGIRIVEEDGEGFDSPEMYQEFIEELADISNEELDIIVEGADEGILTLLINEEKIKVKYEEDNQWFDENVIETINKFIKENEFTEKRFCFIAPFGIAQMDSFINMAFIDEALYDTLVEKSFAADASSLYHF